MSNCRYIKGDPFRIILNRVLAIVLTETDIKDFDYSFHGVRVECACDRARWIGKKKPARSSFPMMLLCLHSLARSLLASSCTHTKDFFMAVTMSNAHLLGLCLLAPCSLQYFPTWLKASVVVHLCTKIDAQPKINLPRCESKDSI